MWQELFSCWGWHSEQGKKFGSYEVCGRLTYELMSAFQKLVSASESVKVQVSVVSDSLWPRGLYSPWNCPGQNAGVGSLSLLQGIFQPRNQTGVSCIAGRFFTHWAMRKPLKWSYLRTVLNLVPIFASVLGSQEFLLLSFSLNPMRFHEVRWDQFW